MESLNHFEDRDLSERLSRLKDFYNNNHAKLVRTAGSLMNGDFNDNAEDLLHETYIKAMKNIPSLDDLEKLPAWFNKIMKNIAIDKFRRKKQNKVHIDEVYSNGSNYENGDRLWEPRDESLGIEEFLILNQQKDSLPKMRKAVEEEHPDFLGVFDLLLDESIGSDQEKALSLGIPINTWKSRKTRLISFLKGKFNS